MRSKNRKDQKPSKKSKQDYEEDSDSDSEIESDSDEVVNNNLDENVDDSDEEEAVSKPTNGVNGKMENNNLPENDDSESDSEMEASTNKVVKKSKKDDDSDDDSWVDEPIKSKKIRLEENQLSENDGSDEDDSEGDQNHDEVRVPVINPLHFIRNKEKRKEIFKKMKIEKSKKKRAERKQKKRDGAPRNPGHTIESLREIDQTAITNLNEEENQELEKELEQDDFANYFEAGYDPKIVITFSDNPNTRTRKFGLELSRIFPNSLVKLRNRSSVKKMCKSCEREGFTDLIIVNENRHKPNGLLIIHLPAGPTFHFKVSNVKLTKDIRRDHKEITKHRPELVLTNFTTRLGLTVGRMFGALFNHDPEYRGRRVCTFHNQRDFIFFRHHRYEFAKQGKKAKLRELGPRFTLKLRSIQEGTFDSKTGDYSWIIANKRHAMEGRRKFYL